VAFMTLTSGRMIPTMVLLGSRVPKMLRARFLAVNTAVSDAASGLGTWLGGALLSTQTGGALVGFDRLGWVAVAVTLSALVVLWRLSLAPKVETEARSTTEAEYGSSA
jgi:MFS transporter, DHA1 family, inner membrane transport protein